MKQSHYRLFATVALLSCCWLMMTSFTLPRSQQESLLQYYSPFIASHDAKSVTMNNGTRISLQQSHNAPDRLTPSQFENWLNTATLGDQLLQDYYAGKPEAPPQVNIEPGRARSEEFFEAVYGASEHAVNSRCTTVRWTDGTPLRITTVLGCNKHLQAVVDELKALPASFQKYLARPGGTLNWRVIAGTKRRSTHSYGIAIDINVTHSHYWRNVRTVNGKLPYKNSIPIEIVEIFEKHGFIWGGKWYHFDTMHFEFRPELCPPRCSCK
ncbi:MAG: M15 family metallopeptidase [Candidatus Kapabacteria bacterium]|nr:M15 family metallopeptidase [Candidatus Kapabacteria bacterium]